MRRGQGRRMRGEGGSPGGFPGRGGGRRRRFRGRYGQGMRRRGPVDAATRVEQIAKRRGISTEQASELYKQRQERRNSRKAARTERRIDRVSQRRGINKEDARKLIADRAAGRQARRASGQDGAPMSRRERIAGRKKEFLSRVREKMGMGKGKRKEFQDRMGRGRRGGGGGGGRMGRDRRGAENGRGRFPDRMVKGGTPGFYDRNSPNYLGGDKARQIRREREQRKGRGRFPDRMSRGRRGGEKGRGRFPDRMVIGGTPGFYDRNSPNYFGGGKARQIVREREQRAPGGRGARRGMRRRMRGGQEQVGTMVGS